MVVSASAAGLAQQPMGQWERVQTLRVGAPIHVSLTGRKTVRCTFDSADQASLTCHQRRAQTEHSLTLQRADIRSIHARNILGSAAVGLVVGAGVGAGVGAAVDAGIKDPNTANNAKFMGGLARAGGLLGGLGGAATEFVPGKTLYKADVAK